METSLTPTPVSAITKSHQTNNFDVIRFVLALCVIFAHSFDLMKRPDPLSPLILSIGIGGEAVLGFFFLSGYLITMSWMRSHSLVEYLKRRALRIYPGFIVVCLFCGLIAGPLCSYSPAWYWRHFQPGAFLTHIVELRLIAAPSAVTSYSTSDINGSLWTIHEEFLCYLIVALFGSLKLFNRRAAILSLLPLVYVLIFTLTRFAPLLHLNGTGEIFRLPSLLIAFFTGSCFFLYRDKIVYSARGAAICLVGTLGLMHCGYEAGLLSLPFMAYLLFALAFNPRIRLHRFAQHGDFSYGVYLYAMPVQILLLRYFSPSLTPWTLFLLATPLTIFCAVLSWRFVEEPFLRRAVRSK